MYEEWISIFGEPDQILCDNGGEFEGIQTDKLTTPSNHPQANSVLERFHKELAVMCRVHNCTPEFAVQHLRSHQSKLMFFSSIKVKYSEPAICPFTYGVRIFNEYELVWKHVPRRGRKKHEGVFTGPHRVLKKLGDYTYLITSHRTASRNRTIKINVNDIKKFTIPDTTGWKVNPKYLDPAKAELNCNEEVPVILDFQNLDSFTLDNISNDFSPKLFILPDWPCMAWYKPMHELVVADAAALPNKPDLFIDENGNPIGSLAWKHWLILCKE